MQKVQNSFCVLGSFSFHSMKQHWLVLSDPLEYSVEHFVGQKTVNWESGLSIPSNKELSQMRKRDTVLFISTGNVYVSYLSSKQYLELIRMAH